LFVLCEVIRPSKKKRRRKRRKKRMLTIAANVVVVFRVPHAQAWRQKALILINVSAWQAFSSPQMNSYPLNNPPKENTAHQVVFQIGERRLIVFGLFLTLSNTPLSERCVIWLLNWRAFFYDWFRDDETQNLHKHCFSNTQILEYLICLKRQPSDYRVEDLTISSKKVDWRFWILFHWN
jgi:hypothetical protein